MIYEYLEQYFIVPSFGDSFIGLNQIYSNLELGKDISDSERISEYKWIVQQYRKYIGKQKDVILNCRKKEEVLAEIDNLISKTTEYGDTRKEIVYNIMRDDFLARLYNATMFYEEEMPEEEEDEEDE